MKKFTLISLALAAIIAPSSLYPIDTTKDGITIRVSNEQNRSEVLKSNGLACLYIRIKNDTGAPIEIPKYALSSTLVAHEKMLTEVMGGSPINRAIAKFIVSTGTFLGVFLTFQTEPFMWHRRLGYMNISLFTSTTWAITSYLKQAPINTMLQEYLDRKVTTIQMDSEFGFYFYIDLDQYRRSISKNIILRMYKKGTNEAILIEIDTTSVLRIPIA